MNAKVVYIDDIAVNVLMAQRRMKQKELASLAGIGRGNLSVLLKRGTVRPKTADLIAAALNVDVEEIMREPPEGEITKQED